MNNSYPTNLHARENQFQISLTVLADLADLADLAY